MATSVGQIGLDLVLNQNQFQKQMAGITNTAKKAGAALATVFSAKAITNFAKESTQLGSDLQEVENIINVTFSSMSAQMDSFAKSAASSFGLSEKMAKRYSALYGTMAKQVGFTEEDAYNMGSSLAGLAGDVASFYDISQDEAYVKLKSVFSGETETLKDIGIVMNIAALDAYALSNGYGKVTAAMTQGEKVALRYDFVQRQLGAAQGDFARTSGSWANQTRVLGIQFENLKATLGQGLINVFTPLMKGVNALIGRLGELAESFLRFSEMITGNKATAGNASSALTEIADSASNLEENVSSAGEAAQSAAADMKALMGFDQINKLDEADDSSSSSTSSELPSISPSPSPQVDLGAYAQGEAVIDEFGRKFLAMMQAIRTAVQPTVEAINRLWNEGLAKLGEFTWGTIKDFWNNFLLPMGNWMLSDSAGLPRFFDITNALLNNIDWGRLQTSLANFYSVLLMIGQFAWNTMMDFYQNFLMPIGVWTMNDALPRFLDITSAIANSIDWERLRTSLANFYTALQSPVQQYVNVLLDFYRNFLQPVAVWTMSEAIPRLLDCCTRFWTDVNWDGIRGGLNSVWDAIAPFAINVGEGLLWFIENVLTPFSTWVENEVVPRFLETLATVIETLNNVLTALQPLFQWFWDSMLKPLAEWTGGVFLGVWDGINSALQTFSDWCRDNPEAIQNIAIIVGSFFAAFKIVKTISGIVSFVKNIGSVIGVVKNLGTLIGGVLNPWTLALAAIIAIGVLVWKNWDTIKEKALQIWGAIKDWFGKTIDGIKQFFTGLWNGISDTFKAVGEWFTKVFQDAWKGIKQAFANVENFFLNIWNGICNTFASVGTWFSNIFQGAWNGIKQAFANVKNFFSDVWNGITSIFGNVVGWFKDQFTNAWEAVKNVFSAGGRIFDGIKDGILNGLKTVINALIDGINKVVQVPFDGINWALDNLRNLDIMGLRPFEWLGTIAVPQIPKLAQGGYVKANTPQLAMIGDNRHQGEVVAPEGKLQAMVDEAVRRASTGGVESPEVVQLLRQILEILLRVDIVRLDPESLRKYFISKTNANTKATGACEILV